MLPVSCIQKVKTYSHMTIEKVFFVKGRFSSCLDSYEYDNLHTLRLMGDEHNAKIANSVKASKV